MRNRPSGSRAAGPPEPKSNPGRRSPDTGGVRRVSRAGRGRLLAVFVALIGLLGSLGGVGLSTLFAPAASAATQPWQRYDFQTLDNPADLTFNQLLGINDGGTIAGYFGSGNPPTTHPNQGYTLVPPSTYTSENFPGSQQTQVVGINNTASTVGFYTNPAQANFGFAKVGASFSSFTNPAGTASPSFDQLLAVNNANLAAGFYNDNAGNAHAYTVNIVGPPVFTPVNPPGASSATAAGINDANDVSGFETVGGVTQGFLKVGATFTTLMYPGSTSTEAFQLNSSFPDPQVVGSYVDALGQTHGFLYQGGQWQTIDDPNGYGTTTINGINLNGSIVGFYMDGAGNTHGFLGTKATVPNGNGLLTVNRLAGAERIGTAIAISQQSFTAGSASTVTLATSQNFPDALAGGPLAAAMKGPLLLTDPGSLTPATQAEIQRVLPAGKTVFLLGGSAALSASIDTTLTGLGYKPMRLAGADRFGTAVQVANQVPGVKSIFETTGLNFPDSLASGPAAIQPANSGVILLTNGSSQSPDTASYIGAHPSFTRFAVGGPAASADPGATAIVGATRFETAAMVATKFFSGAKSVGGATGLNFPDALSAGPLLGTSNAPLLLLDPTGIHTTTGNYLSGNVSTIGTGGGQVFIFGGTAAVTDGEVGQVVQLG